jgi:hypothetical protein
MENFYLNFDILEDANEANEFMVRIEIDINNKGKKMPGYVISLKTDANSILLVEFIL